MSVARFTASGFSLMRPRNSPTSVVDAHAHEVFGRRLVIDRFDVRVHIDETWRKHLSTRVDGPARGVWSYMSNTRYASVFDRHVGLEPRVTRTIDDACVCDEKIVGRRGRCDVYAYTREQENAEKERSQQHCCRLKEETRFHCCQLRIRCY